MTTASVLPLYLEPRGRARIDEEYSIDPALSGTDQVSSGGIQIERSLSRRAFWVRF